MDELNAFVSQFKVSRFLRGDITVPDHLRRQMDSLKIYPTRLYTYKRFREYMLPHVDEMMARFLDPEFEYHLQLEELCIEFGHEDVSNIFEQIVWSDAPMIGSQFNAYRGSILQNQYGRTNLDLDTDRIEMLCEDIVIFEMEKIASLSKMMDDFSKNAGIVVDACDLSDITKIRRRYTKNLLKLFLHVMHPLSFSKTAIYNWCCE